LTDIATGVATIYRTGDSWFVTKGTEVLWEIEGELCMKHYFAVV
jgi:hypothetical protein